MKLYRIVNRTSGQEMGIYNGEDEDNALQNMLDDAGDCRPIQDRSDWLVNIVQEDKNVD